MCTIKVSDKTAKEYVIFPVVEVSESTFDYLADNAPKAVEIYFGMLLLLVTLCITIFGFFLLIPVLVGKLNSMYVLIDIITFFGFVATLLATRRVLTAIGWCKPNIAFVHGSSILLCLDRGLWFTVVRVYACTEPETFYVSDGKLYVHKDLLKKFTFRLLVINSMIQHWSRELAIKHELQQKLKGGVQA